MESAASGQSQNRRQPIRTCVACRTSGGKKGLLRVVRLPEGAGAGAGVVLDRSGKQSGRGAYVCPTENCVTMALKRKQLERSLKTTLPSELAEALKAEAVKAEAVKAEAAATAGAQLQARSAGEGETFP